MKKHKGEKQMKAGVGGPWAHIGTPGKDNPDAVIISTKEDVYNTWNAGEEWSLQPGDLSLPLNPPEYCAFLFQTPPPKPGALLLVHKPILKRYIICFLALCSSILCSLPFSPCSFSPHTPLPPTCLWPAFPLLFSSH